MKCFLPWTKLNKLHTETTICARGAEIKRWRLVEEGDRAGALTAFRDYNSPLETVLSFNYLGHVLAATDDDWLSVISNLQKARYSWSYLAWILGWEGTETRTTGSFKSPSSNKFYCSGQRRRW